MIGPTQVAEITPTIRQLQAEFEDLAVGGLATLGPERLPVLEALAEDLEQVGALHLAGRLQTLATAIRTADRGAAAALMRAQISLRLAERILTLKIAAASLQVEPANPAIRDRA